MQQSEGFKANWTVKEKAIRKLVEEQQEKESIQQYENVMGTLGIEVLK